MKWNARKLKEICSRVTSGGTPATTEPSFYGGDIHWLRTQEVNFNFITDTEIKITEAGLENSSAKWIPENSVIVALYGNSAGRVSINKIPLTTNQACGNFIVDSIKADYRFVYYALQKDYEVLRGLSKGAAQNNLNLAILREYDLSVPDLQDQRRIADVLIAYDDLIENNKRRMTLLEETARLIYREWFVHLRFPGHEHTSIRDGLPKEWTKGVVEDFYDTASGGTPSRSCPEYFTGEIPWVKTQELPNGFVTETQEQITEDGLSSSSAKLFPARTVLVALYGATVGELGILAMQAATNQACCALFPKDSRAHYIHAFLFLRENKEKLMSLSAGAAQNNISQQIIRAYAMVMPSKVLMQAFIDSLTPVFDQWLNLDRQNQKLRAARNLLLPRLMSGEVMV